jgi:cyanophycinase
MTRSTAHLTLHLVAAIFLCAAFSWQSAQVADKPVVGPENGSLVIVGGGFPTPEIMSHFMKLAGGNKAKIVDIPTAMDVDPRSGRGLNPLTAAGASHVAVLHTYDRRVADSEDFVAPLKTATAVWFNGGRQWRLVDAYLGTRTLTELFGVLQRGGVIGGNSAGATIIGSYLVRGAPEGPDIMISPGHEEGFGFLRGVAIDQHIHARERVHDMQQVIDAHPDLLGIGIDENTAIIVTGDSFYVIGEGQVEITDNNHPPDKHGNKYYFLKRGDKFNLRTREIEKK